MIITGIINAHSLSDFPKTTMSYGARNSQPKYPAIASKLSVKIRMPKVLSFIGWFTLELEA